MASSIATLYSSFFQSYQAVRSQRSNRRGPSRNGGRSVFGKLSLFCLLLVACDSTSDRHALTGPESARLVSHIAIKPSWGIVEPDEVEEFVAHVKSGRGLTVSRQVTWATSDGSVLDVDASGRVLGVNEGSAALAASYQGLTEQITVDVKGEVVELRLSHTSLTLEEGQSQQLTATYIYANGAERPAGRVQWQSSDPSIIQIDSDGLARAVSSGTTTITAQSRGQKTQSEGVVNTGRVAKVEVGAPTTKLEVGQEVQFWADIWDADGNRMQKNVQWSSSNTSVATVSSDGVVRGQGAGQATITAKSGPESGSLGVEVTSEPVSEEEKASRPGGVTTLSVPSTGETKATLRFTEVDDGTGSPAKYEVRYALSPLGLGWGTATTVTKGTCAVPLEGTGIGNTLTCTVEGLQPSTTYDFQLVAYRGTLNQDAEFGPLSNIATGTTDDAAIQVEVLPSGATLEEEQQVQLEATVTDAYGNELNKSVSWSSSRTSVATVSSSGLVTAVAPGDAEIRATADGVSDVSNIKVAQPVGGFSLVTRNPWNELGTDGWTTAWNNQGLMSVVKDGTAPSSGSCCNVLQHKYPVGFEGGSGPASADYNFGGKRAVLVATWWKANDGWQGHKSGINKLMFIFPNQSGVGNWYINWYYTGALRVAPQHPDGWKWLEPNVNDSPLEDGRWYYIEWLLEHEGGRYWTVKWWVDGVLRGDHQNVRWSDADLSILKMNPTWGGTGDSKTQEDHFRWDETSISVR